MRQVISYTKYEILQKNVADLQEQLTNANKRIIILSKELADAKKKIKEMTERYMI